MPRKRRKTYSRTEPARLEAVQHKLPPAAHADSMKPSKDHGAVDGTAAWGDRASAARNAGKALRVPSTFHGADFGRNARAVAQLQRTHGNAFVQRMIRTSLATSLRTNQSVQAMEQEAPLVQREEEKEASIAITYGPNASASVVSAYTIQVLKDILKAVGETGAMITSTARDAHNQARVMYDNIEAKGVESQKSLYGSSGDKVIDVYVASKKANKSRDEIIQDMEDKINEIGCSNVSRHCADPKVLGVIDVAPSSIANKKKFVSAARAEKRVSKFLEPPADPAYHLEIPQSP